VDKPVDGAPKESWTLAELAAETGQSPRTIRFYIARGLLEGPGRAGRGSTYDTRHLERLRRIRELQDQGLTLAEVAHAVAGPAAAEALPEPVVWQSYKVAPDVTVQVRGGASPWRLRRIREALAEFAARVRDEDEGDT
jgi:DNA-binding transcriptional MerR regulator